MVTQEEPATLSTFSSNCNGGVLSTVCEEVASDPFLWIDSNTFQVVPLSLVRGWSQVAPDRWRFKLQGGVSFHNGEPWDAAAAKLGLDWMGDEETRGHGRRGYEIHGPISSEVMDELTVDVICGTACPIFPRTATYATFQAPGWWDSATEEERETLTVGTGPYQIVEWQPGVEVELKAFEAYRPNASFASQAPSIKRAFQMWQSDAFVRAAMVDVGEADWAADIGIGNRQRVPQFQIGTDNEIVTLVADNIWHPELKKKQVREALALAVDCQLLMETLYEGAQTCWGSIFSRGTVGLNESNAAPYPYDPERSKELLADSEYDPENVIRIHARGTRFGDDIQLWKSVVTMWEEVGVNAEVSLLGASESRDVRRSGCGNYAENALSCADLGAPEPTLASSHYFETTTFSAAMDMQRQLLLRTNCFNVNSRVCDLVPGLQGAITNAIATPMGPARAAKMAVVAQKIHDEYWFIPLFAPAQIYGMAPNLVWKPRYDTRLRINTMTFAK